MFDLGVATLPTAYMLASLTACPAATPAAVSFDFQNNKARLVNNLTSAQLGQFHVSTTFSRSPKEVFRTGGLTQADFSPRINVSFEIAQTEDGLQCLSVKHVDLSLVFLPIIYVAQEFKPGSCRYKDTLVHELRHVNTAVITLNEYIPKMKSAAQDAAATALQNQKTGTPEEIKERQKQAFAFIRDAVDDTLVMTDKINFQRQQAIDTRQEYLRSTKACPNEPVP